MVSASGVSAAAAIASRKLVKPSGATISKVVLTLNVAIFILPYPIGRN
ncbi:hypothetical protein LKE08_19755 [Lyngbya sp. CCY1209]|nr:hypothetical protein [Lyngbya sp. CCY1209]